MKSQKNFPQKPLLPYITLEHLAAFDPAKPETWTESRLVNEVMLAIEVVGTKSGKNIASYLNIDQQSLSSAIEIITGMKLTEFKHEVCIIRLKKAVKEAPYLSSDQLAQKLGYADRASLFKALGRDFYDTYLAKYKWDDTQLLKQVHYW